MSLFSEFLYIAVDCLKELEISVLSFPFYVLSIMAVTKFNTL